MLRCPGPFVVLATLSGRVGTLHTLAIRGELAVVGNGGVAFHGTERDRLAGERSADGSCINATRAADLNCSSEFATRGGDGH